MECGTEIGENNKEDCLIMEWINKKYALETSSPDTSDHENLVAAQGMPRWCLKNVSVKYLSLLSFKHLYALNAIHNIALVLSILTSFHLLFFQFHSINSFISLFYIAFYLHDMELLRQVCKRLSRLMHNFTNTICTTFCFKLDVQRPTWFFPPYYRLSEISWLFHSPKVFISRTSTYPIPIN